VVRTRLTGGVPDALAVEGSERFGGAQGGDKHDRHPGNSITRETDLHCAQAVTRCKVFRGRRGLSRRFANGAS
jgi:hypothetical protein